MQASRPSTLPGALKAVVPKQSLISIVDDDESFRDSMRRLVKSWATPVAVFASAAEFLASPRLAATDCLVADIHMPEMSRRRALPASGRNGHAIPTILVTAYPDDSVQERMLSEGVGCYLRKPLEEAYLIDCLHSAAAAAWTQRGTSRSSGLDSNSRSTSTRRSPTNERVRPASRRRSGRSTR